MRIAWLLRADLRQGSPAGGPLSDWFKMWWLANGVHEYPAWAHHDAIRNARLFKPLPQWPMYGGFGMTPALRSLLETRKDLANKFDISRTEGLWDAISWLFAHGVQENKLASALDDKTLAALDATPPFFMSKTVASDEKPEVTWLMFFVWRTTSNLQSHFDLQHADDRQRYVAWFLLDGVKRLKLAPLIAPRWKNWLREHVLSTQSGMGVPRATYLLWQQHKQLQQAFDLKTEKGVNALAVWTAEVWNTQKELSWIDEVEESRHNHKFSQGKRPFGLNLIGFAFGELGIGEDVRMAVSACEAAGIPFTIVNIQPGSTLRQADWSLISHVEKSNARNDKAPYAFNLFCLTAFDTARVFLEQGDSLFGDRYNIGWWPWELPVWPQDWLPAFDLVDEIWAATSFTYSMYTKATSLVTAPPPRVTLMPMPASVDRVTSMTREELGLPPDKYLFLYVFDFNSYLARKNPFATVAAFREAFDIHDESVGLVLKTMNANPTNPEWMRFLQICKEDSRIIIIDQTLDRGQVLGMIQSCDAYVSLHRAEGFGRTLAEAMLFGKPVVATNFSGNVDFLTEETGFPVEFERVQTEDGEYPFVTSTDQAWWACPIKASAVEQMRAARSARNTNKQGEGIVSFATSRFSSTVIGPRILDRLKKIRSHPSSINRT